MLAGPWKRAEFVELVLILHQHWYRVLMEVKSDGHWRPRNSVNQHSEAEDCGQDTRFEEVPWSLLRHGQWKHVWKVKWPFSEDTMLEARAMVLSTRRIVRTQYGGSIRQLFHCDNSGTVLAFERCRSCHFGVLTQIRQFLWTKHRCL